MTEAWVLVPGDRIVIDGLPVTVTAVHERVDDALRVHLPACMGGHPAVAVDWVGDERLPDGSPRVLGRRVWRCSAEVKEAPAPE